MKRTRLARWCRAPLSIQSVLTLIKRALYGVNGLLFDTPGWLSEYEGKKKRVSTLTSGIFDRELPSTRTNGALNSGKKKLVRMPHILQQLGNYLIFYHRATFIARVFRQRHKNSVAPAIRHISYWKEQFGRKIKSVSKLTPNTSVRFFDLKRFLDNDAHSIGELRRLPYHSQLIVLHPTFHQAPPSCSLACAGTMLVEGTPSFRFHITSFSDVHALLNLVVPCSEWAGSLHEDPLKGIAEGG